MAEANFDANPIPYDADAKELDVEMKDAGNETGETNFMADIEVLDALYLRDRND